MPAAESAAIVRELIAMGLSRRAIGQAVGRNDRLIGYVEKGIKPGHNLAPALAALRDRLAGVAAEERRSAARTAAVPAPERRTTAGGRTARVRRPRVVSSSARHTTARVGRQAAQHGARGLARIIDDAAARGQLLAITLTVSWKLFAAVEDYGGKRGKKGAAKGGLYRIDIAGDGRGRGAGIDAAAFADTVREHDDDVTAAALAWLWESGRVEEGEADEEEWLGGELVEQVVGVEVRVWG